jgi:hypothetical protein
MIMAASPGSDGGGEPRFDAYLPFTLAPGGALNFEGIADGTVAQTTYRLEKQPQGLYSLRARGFSSEAQAIAALDGLRASLLWFALKTGAGVRYEKELGTVDLYEDPLPAPPAEGNMVGQVARDKGWDATDGSFDSDAAVVVPEHKRLVKWQGGRVTTILSISLGNFFGHLASTPGLGAGVGINDDKLVLAIELYAAHRFEEARNVRLISLVTALETLLPHDAPVSTEVNEAIDNALAAVRALRIATPPKSPHRADLLRLASRLGDLRRESIGAKLRTLAESAVARNPALGVAGEITAALAAAYKCRSDLVHNGSAESEVVSASLGFLSVFVPRLLEQLFRESADAIAH